MILEKVGHLERREGAREIVRRVALRAIPRCRRTRPGCAGAVPDRHRRGSGNMNPRHAMMRRTQPRRQPTVAASAAIVRRADFRYLPVTD